MTSLRISDRTQGQDIQFWRTFNELGADAAVVAKMQQMAGSIIANANNYLDEQPVFKFNHLGHEETLIWGRYRTIEDQLKAVRNEFHGTQFADLLKLGTYETMGEMKWPNDPDTPIVVVPSFGSAESILQGLRKAASIPTSVYFDINTKKIAWTGTDVLPAVLFTTTLNLFTQCPDPSATVNSLCKQADCRRATAALLAAAWQFPRWLSRWTDGPESIYMLTGIMINDSYVPIIGNRTPNGHKVATLGLVNRYEKISKLRGIYLVPTIVE